MTKPPDLPGLPAEVPSDLPLTAPAVIVVDLTDGGTLYRCFDDEFTAQAAWEDGITLAHKEKAFLFINGILVAFHSRL